MLKNSMLVVDLYSLLPAFTLVSFLAILLWPEDIAFKRRLQLFMGGLGVWILASFLGMAGYGTTEKPTVCFINLIVGLIGFIAVYATYRMHPSRR